ncbi:MAG: glycosyltransferase family 2 protein [Oscillospiraceae bacterium]|nr:glycosyltransferase family 2 protein [Oscillospiraceae bacterium]
MAEISVIVPVYKVEAYLERCVSSILRQSFSDFELILVDDGSPDNCPQMCDAYALRDSRIHVIHQKNSGLSAARNAGIDWVQAHSSSNWIAFVDSDDWVHEDYLMLLYEAVRETGCQISCCGFVKTSGEPIAEPVGEYRVMTAEDFYCTNFGGLGGEAPIAWNKLYAKSLFGDIRYPLGKLHEDEFTTYRLVFSTDKIAYNPAALYAYYQNDQGIMLSKWNPRRLHILEAVEQQIVDAVKWNNTKLQQKAVMHYIYAVHEHLPVADPQFHKQLRRQYRKALKLGRQSGAFSLCWDHLWAYEEAYPVKLFWWTLFRGKQLLSRSSGKDSE